MSAEGKLHKSQNWYLIADDLLNINITIYTLHSFLISKYPRLFPKTYDNQLLCQNAKSTDG